ncbi:MAG TPA: nucleoside diphosphate kinase regulator [Hyphomicrobiales bacterium]|nr:nucleoside diphosphate kinase regulator [Hyphomicrobiales bacterium]
MTAIREATHAPWIVLDETQHERLSQLAAAARDRAPEAATRLLAELDRAEVVSAGRLPANVVTIGSTVTFRDHDSERPRRVTLVYPAEADIAAGRISVLTPVGTALLGLSTGQSIAWLGLDGHDRHLTVLAVTPPAPEPAAAA